MHCKLWSGRRESNPRPTAWKAVTLPLSYSRLNRLPSCSRRSFSASTFCPLVLQLPAVAPRPNREHRQYRQRRQPELLIVDGDPRQNHQHGERAQGHPQPLHSESWCTGEDSNLRSPLGAADLQSAAINHSATCARTAEQTAGPVSPVRYHIKEPLAKPAVSPATLRNRRTIRLPRKIGSGKLLLGSVLSESSASCLACFCCYASRRAQRPKSGAGEGI